VPESPHPNLLDRALSEKHVADLYKKQVWLLTDLANYGSNLVVRSLVSSERELRDLVVCGVLLKQFTSMIDAIDLLVRGGASYAAYLPARAALEASLFIEWILVSDGEKKAAYYFVGNQRRERTWALRVQKGTKEAKDFLKDMGRIGQDLLDSRPSLEGVGKSAAEQLTRILSDPSFEAVNRVFDEARKTKLHDADWYKLLGKRSLRAIALELHRIPEYELIYAKGSEVIHSGSYKEQLQFKKNAATLKPIRYPADLSTFLTMVFSTAIYTYQRVLGFYRRPELADFERRYIAEWREPYLNMPRVKVDEMSSGEVL
jgi:hypothetical protein